MFGPFTKCMVSIGVIISYTTCSIYWILHKSTKGGLYKEVNTWRGDGTVYIWLPCSWYKHIYKSTCKFLLIRFAAINVKVDVWEWQAWPCPYWPSGRPVRRCGIPGYELVPAYLQFSSTKSGVTFPTQYSSHLDRENFATRDKNLLAIYILIRSIQPFQTWIHCLQELPNYLWWATPKVLRRNKLDLNYSQGSG